MMRNRKYDAYYVDGSGRTRPAFKCFKCEELRAKKPETSMQILFDKYQLRAKKKYQFNVWKEKILSKWNEFENLIYTKGGHDGK